MQRYCFFLNWPNVLVKKHDFSWFLLVNWRNMILSLLRIILFCNFFDSIPWYCISSWNAYLSLLSTLKQHVLYYRNKHGNAIERTVFSAKSRHDYPPPPTTGTREAQMEPLGTIWNYLERPKGNWNSRRLLERAKRIWNAPGSGTPALRLLERRAAPYPYSKMCELCELCELL